MNKEIKILNCKVNIISKQEVLDKIKSLLLSESGEQRQIVTTNPEFILTAQKDKEFRGIINDAWISVVDGYGIRLAAKYLSLTRSPKVSSAMDKNTLLNCYIVTLLQKIFYGFKIAWWGIVRNDKKLDVVKDVITGTDLVSEICKLANYESRITNRKIKIYLLGALDDVPRLTAEKLKQQFSNLTIYYSIFEIIDVIEKINQGKPDILFVALGAPRQDKWIAKNLHKMPSLKLAIGVGGAFDYISEKIKRAPIGWRHSFEWMFRLVQQPKRVKRIFNAAIRFPWLVFKKRHREYH